MNCEDNTAPPQAAQHGTAAKQFSLGNWNVCGINQEKLGNIIDVLEEHGLTACVLTETWLSFFSQEISVRGWTLHRADYCTLAETESVNLDTRSRKSFLRGGVALPVKDSENMVVTPLKHPGKKMSHGNPSAR